MKTLTANVVVTEPGTVEPTVLLEGSTAPEWALSLLGEHVLADAEGIPVEAKDDEPEGDKNLEGDKNPEDNAQSDPKNPVEPVRIPNAPGTAGGSAKAWAAYALANGFEIEGDAKAQEIYDALAAEGVAVRTHTN